MRGSSVVKGIEPPAAAGKVVTISTRPHGQVLEVDAVSHAARIQAASMAGHRGPVRDTPFTMRHYMQAYRCSTLGGWIATRSAATTPRSTPYRRFRGEHAGRHAGRNARDAPPAGVGRRSQSDGCFWAPRAFWHHHRSLVRLRKKPTFRASTSVRFKTFFDGAMRFATSPRPASIRQLPAAGGARGACPASPEQRGAGWCWPSKGRPSARRLDGAGAGNLPRPGGVADPTGDDENAHRSAPPAPGATSSSCAALRRAALRPYGSNKSSSPDRHSDFAFAQIRATRTTRRWVRRGREAIAGVGWQRGCPFVLIHHGRKLVLIGYSSANNKASSFAFRHDEPRSTRPTATTKLFANTIKHLNSELHRIEGVAASFDAPGSVDDRGQVGPDADGQFRLFRIDANGTGVAAINNPISAADEFAFRLKSIRRAGLWRPALPAGCDQRLRRRSAQSEPHRFRPDVRHAGKSISEFSVGNDDKAFGSALDNLGRIVIVGIRAAMLRVPDFSAVGSDQFPGRVGPVPVIDRGCATAPKIPGPAASPPDCRR